MEIQETDFSNSYGPAAAEALRGVVEPIVALAATRLAIIDALRTYWLAET